MENKKCYFSTDITETTSCNYDGNFDFNRFPVRKCPWYPCEKYKEVCKKVNEDLKAVNKCAKKEQD